MTYSLYLFYFVAGRSRLDVFNDLFSKLEALVGDGLDTVKLDEIEDIAHMVDTILSKIDPKYVLK